MAAAKYKDNKPEMEKKRRSRINESISCLKLLVLGEVRRKNTRISKLDKADILEMAVEYVQNMNVAGSPDFGSRPTPARTPHKIDRYRAGFNACAEEVRKHLATTAEVDTDLRTRIVDHLANFVQNLQWLRRHDILPYDVRNRITDSNTMYCGDHIPGRISEKNEYPIGALEKPLLTLSEKNEHPIGAMQKPVLPTLDKSKRKSYKLQSMPQSEGELYTAQGQYVRGPSLWHEGKHPRNFEQIHSSRQIKINKGLYTAYQTDNSNHGGDCSAIKSLRVDYSSKVTGQATRRNIDNNPKQNMKDLSALGLYAAHNPNNENYAFNGVKDDDKKGDSQNQANVALPMSPSPVREVHREEGMQVEYTQTMWRPW